MRTITGEKKVWGTEINEGGRKEGRNRWWWRAGRITRVRDGPRLSTFIPSHHSLSSPLPLSTPKRTNNKRKRLYNDKYSIKVDFSALYYILLIWKWWWWWKINSSLDTTFTEVCMYICMCACVCKSVRYVRTFSILLYVHMEGLSVHVGLCNWPFLPFLRSLSHLFPISPLRGTKDRCWAGNGRART